MWLTNPMLTDRYYGKREKHRKLSMVKNSNGEMFIIM